MNYFLLFGAGKSSYFLIEYLSHYCAQHQLVLKVVDRDISYMFPFYSASSTVQFLTLDTQAHEQIKPLIQKAEIVISLLPADLHIHIAHWCLEYNRNLCTASYVSDAMKALNETVKNQNLVFLNEVGLDPGIDHLSAIQLIENIKSEGGQIQAFRSYTGGLVADEDDGDNPWKYKFTWNPRNVVVAGQGAPAQYLHNNTLKLLPYHRLFESVLPFSVQGITPLEGYPNRDSLKYINAYGLQNVNEMIRGTLRKKGYCQAWQVLVKLGMTDDSLPLDLPVNTSIKDWWTMYLPCQASQFKDYFQLNDEIIHQLEWIGLMSDNPLPLLKGTSAQILETILKEKWCLQPDDKDLIVMIHEIDYEINGTMKRAQSVLHLNGESNIKTAMAKTVGLPLAIAVVMVYEQKVEEKGVIIPTDKHLGAAILKQLEAFGVVFKETEWEL